MKKTIILAGGCFWGLDAYLGNLNGVLDTKAAYANSNIKNPSYEDVCNGQSTAVEAVIVEFDNAIISLMHLLGAFYEVIDPTSVNRQANDIGAQYRSGIYYIDQSDLKTINSSIQELQSKLNKSVKIEVLPLENIYLAEEYHQNYLKKNPNGYCHIPSKTIQEAKNKGAVTSE